MSGFRRVCSSFLPPLSVLRFAFQRHYKGMSKALKKSSLEFCHFLEVPRGGACNFWLPVPFMIIPPYWVYLVYHYMLDLSV